MSGTCRFCLEPCESNGRLIERNFREKAQDVFVLQISIAKKNNAAVCDSCRSQVERFYLFKRKCRQQEELRRDPKATVLSMGFAVQEVKVAPPPADPEQETKEPTGSEPENMEVEEKTEKRSSRTKRRNRGHKVRAWNPFTKEQLATTSRAVLYKERYNKICELCGKSRPANQMEEHMNKHRGVQPYACEVLGCVAKFYGAAGLKGHVKRTHSDDQLPCPECGKVFTCETTLANHRKSHAEKPYACEICNLRVRVKSTLRQHMLVHTQQRDHVCKFCGKAFYANTVLTLHLRSHTGERPYACHVCDFSHAHRVLYVKHMQKFHPGEEIRTLAEMKRLAAIASALQQKEQNGEEEERLEEEFIEGEADAGVTYKLEEIEILGRHEGFE
uniref:Zinc finger protein 2 n=1 Tax=Culex pipiens TaxID=7175 RepID=A0A8D7ZTG6_CULPI